MAPGPAQTKLSEFLSQLPEVHDVTDDEECPVCLQSYSPTTAPTTPAPGMIQGFLSMFVRQERETIEPETAVRLPCHHVMGSNCIKRWLSRGEGRNTCPYCVKQLFLPTEHPHCYHPDWDMLMDRLGDYGFALDRDWKWVWRPSGTMARITEKDILEWSMLAKPFATTFAEILLAEPNPVDALRRHHRAAKALSEFDPEQLWAADEQMVDWVLERVSCRVTRHLRETAWYLYYQQTRGGIPALGRFNSEYPFRTLTKYHEDALFREIERDGVFDNQNGSLSHREVWELLRIMGLSPM